MLPYIANFNVREIEIEIGEIEIFAFSETKYSPNSNFMTLAKLMAKLNTLKMETRALLLMFWLELEISGVAVQGIHQNSKKWLLPVRIF